MAALQAQIAKYFGSQGQRIASPLLRAGAVLSEHDHFQRFAPALKPTGAEAEPVATIDVDTAVRTANCKFIDLRSPSEIGATGKIRGAVSAPFFTRTWASRFAQEVGRDPDATYVFYAGANTPDKPQKAGQVLKALGYSKVAALSFDDWMAARAPIEYSAPRGANKQNVAYPISQALAA